MRQHDTSSRTTSSSSALLPAKTSVKRLIEAGSGAVSFFAHRIGHKRDAENRKEELSSTVVTTLDSSGQTAIQQAQFSSSPFQLSGSAQEGESLSPDQQKPLVSPHPQPATPPPQKAKTLGSPDVTLESITFSVRTAVEDAVKRFTAKATAKGIELTSLLSYEVPTPTRGDPGYLRRIIMIMLEEIIACMDSGEIIVRNILVNQTPIHATFRFSVTSMIDSRPPVQTGMGSLPSSAPDLSAAKDLITSLGGEMGEEAQPGIGITYWFSVTFEKQAPKAIPAPPPRKTLRGVRVLIFGDLPTSLSEHFLSWGMLGHSSKEASQTVQMLVTAAQAHTDYNVALLTCQQLDPKVLQLALTIRATPALSSLRLILLAATGKKGDAQRLHRIGVDAYLTMPMTLTEVFDCLTTALSAPARSLNPEARLITRYTIAEAKAQSLLHVLIVDPTYGDQKRTARDLERLGYSADVATNGSEAFAAYSQVSYAAVLLACPLPQREGFTIIAHVRQHDRRLGFHTPIIGLAASHTQGKIDTLRQPGMDAVIAKPVTVATLKETLERCVRNATSTASRSPDLDTSAVCNLETALAHLDGDRELFDEMIELFLAEYPQALVKIKQAITENDSQSLIYSSNVLRGSLSHFQAAGAMSLALQLEQCGRKGDLSHAAALFTQLENLLPCVVSILVNAKVNIAA